MLSAAGCGGVPPYPGIPPEQSFYNNLTVSGGPAPVRAYSEELLADVLVGKIEPVRTPLGLIEWPMVASAEVSLSRLFDPTAGDASDRPVLPVRRGA